MNRLKPYFYFEPKTLPEAIEILAEQSERAFPLAGGTDLLVRMKTGVIEPSTIVNLKQIKGLCQIKMESGKGVRIGALTTIAAIERSCLLQSSHPVIVQAAHALGSPSIRNLATLGGNMGRASPASDIAPSLIVLRARVVLAGPNGKREMDIERLFSGPGLTNLVSAEVITSVFLPEITPRSGAIYLKIGRIQGMDCALVGVATSLTLSENGLEASDARIALASVAPIPFRAKNAEEVILSGSLTKERIKKVAKVAAEEVSPITDMRASGKYRRELVKVLTFKALVRSLELARSVR